jgi:MoaA/NifB/PqqE/SkfB family radical SAM enzyme
VLSILYRGPLASCNYGCAYCPFAKRIDSRAQLRADEAAWWRFVAWCEQQDRELGVFVTPWGEALTRRWYPDGLARLSRLPHVARAAVQTNLSAPLAWLDQADPGKLGLWCTYHPEWTTRARFLAQCARLAEKSVAFSVGVVGFLEYQEEAAALRAALPADVYVWVNAVKRETYSPTQVEAWEAIDPLFRWNLQPYASRGKACRAGESAISVDGDGTMRRCHFVGEPIGNLYADDWQAALRPRVCPAESCRCHIGYVHLEELGLEQVYGAGLLERVPRDEEWRAGARRLPVVYAGG